MNLQPICGQCRVTMRCMKNDFLIRDEAVGDFPSTYWFGDLWKCPSCMATIVTGCGKAMYEENVTDKTRVSAMTFRRDTRTDAEVF